MKRNKIITLFSVMVFCCMLFSTVISLFSMRKISQEHTTEFLKALSSDIYHSISDELSETINVSKTIANDQLLIDLLEQEDVTDQEMTTEKLASYTSRLMDTFSYSWVSIVSDRSKAYYSDVGIYRFIDPENDPDDAWYAEFLELDQEYNVSIGRDSDLPDAWTVFVDTRIENTDGEFLGICGIALEIYNLQQLILNYETEYGIEVLFIDKNGQSQIESGSVSDYASKKYSLPDHVDEDQITINKSGNRTSYIIYKYIDQLDWYMIISDINPYDYTVDYLLIALNITAFGVFLIIAFICLHYISERAGSLFADSYKDNLTGLYNRRAYDDSMARLREMSSLDHVVIAAFDVNSLKQINDSHGHSAGDEVIKGSAGLIQQVFGPYGKCYRTGGDEFVAILEKPVADTDALAERFDRAMSSWHGIHVKSLNISYGIVRGIGKDVTIDELLFMADEQMYRGKRAYYSSTDNDRRRRRD